jgi:RNA-directed DNA polymerase
MGRVLSREIHDSLRGADAVETSGRPRRQCRYREALADPARSKTLRTYPSTANGNRESPRSSVAEGLRPHREVQGHTPMMDERGQSDRPVVPGKLLNKAEEPAAEAVEGRGRAKRNLGERDAFRTPGRADALSALDRVRQAA